ILSDDADYGTETTNLFGTWLSKAGGEILLQAKLSGRGRSIDRLMLFLKENDVFTSQDIDAFFVVSSSLEDTATFIRRARELGFSMPILGTDSIYSARLVSLVGRELMKDVAGVSLYDPFGGLLA